MKSVIKFGLFFILPMIMVILWIGGIFSDRIPPGYAEEQPKIITGVKIDVIKPTKIKETYKLEGYTTSKETAKVATKLMGKVLDVKVNEGDFVKKGQLLAVIDISDIKAKEKEALAGLEELSKAREEALAGREAVLAQISFLEKTYNRMKTLYEENALPRQKLDEIEMKLNTAKAKLKQVEAKLKQLDAKEKQVKAKLKQVKIMESYGYIKAPFNGYVIKKMANVGDMANPGMPLFVVGNTKLQFIANVDVKYIDKVDVGDILNIKIDATGRTYKAKVVEKNNNADPANNSFSIRATIQNPEGLGIGFYGKTYITIDESEKLLIPKTAIKRWNQVEGVFLVSPDGILRFKPVKLGEKYGDKYEVKSGIVAGERIVVDGVEKACDGCKVRL
ncbi:MAG: efflux RND transporter periplasmic adaptor subunit [Hydrogenothermus sp.]|nr:MAG: efflux RND transporter periplasmic adaptor subunit [Hydrogenothermus sp.]